MLNLNLPLNHTGYGRVGVNLIKQAFEAGDKYSLTPIGPTQIEHKFKPAYDAGMSTLFDPDGVSLRVFHQHLMAESVGRGPRWGMPIFELNEFNEVEKHHLKSLDKIIVNSEWAKTVIRNQIDRDASVVPLGFDPTIFFPSHYYWPEDTYVFLSVGKWEKRKGHDILLRAFNDAFSESDDVALWCVHTNPVVPEEIQNSWRKQYMASKLSSKIHLFDWVSSQEQLANIMRQANCGLCLSRGEGFNLELLEMNACGIPCIFTYCGAHKDFGQGDSIPLNELEPAHDGYWFYGQGTWYKWTEDKYAQLVEVMRHMYKTRTRQIVYPNLTWKNTYEQLKNLL